MKKVAIFAQRIDSNILSPITDGLIGLQSTKDERLHNSNFWIKTIVPSPGLAVANRLIKPLGLTNMIRSSDLLSGSWKLG
jgi:hypothetical protein